MSNKGQSLYERLGGIYSIAAVMDDFIDRVMNNPILNANPHIDEAHKNITPAGFKYLVTEFACQAMGGPQQYSGRSMYDSHVHLKMTNREWDAFMLNLRESLEKFGVPQQELSETIALVESVKPEMGIVD